MNAFLMIGFGERNNFAKRTLDWSKAVIEVKSSILITYSHWEGHFKCCALELLGFIAEGIRRKIFRRRPAPIDHDGLSVDEARTRRTQKRDGAGNVFGTAQTIERRHLDIHAAEFGIHQAAFHHRRDCHARRHRVTANTLRPILAGNVFGHRSEATLRRRIIGLAGLAF